MYLPPGEPGQRGAAAEVPEHRRPGELRVPGPPSLGVPVIGFGAAIRAQGTQLQGRTHACGSVAGSRLVAAF